MILNKKFVFFLKWFQNYTRKIEHRHLAFREHVEITTEWNNIINLHL